MDSVVTTEDTKLCTPILSSKDLASICSISNHRVSSLIRKHINLIFNENWEEHIFVEPYPGGGKPIITYILSVKQLLIVMSLFRSSSNFVKSQINFMSTVLDHIANKNVNTLTEDRLKYYLKSSFELYKAKKNYIYILESPSSNTVKIGRSSDPDTRVNAIIKGTIDELNLLLIFKETSEYTESSLHKQLKSHLVPGKREWFYKTKEVSQFIDELKTKDLEFVEYR